MSNTSGLMQSEQHLQAPGPTGPLRLGHVAVLGGSIAGLLVARVLSRHAARVTVIERDVPPFEADAARKGVPQAHHAHVLLQSGLAALRELFPGIDDDLAQQSGPAFDLLLQTRWSIGGEFRPRFESDYRAYAIGRPALEGVVRRRLEATAGVHILYGASATGLSLTGDCARGLVLHDGTRIEADLVVDASGRGTRVPRWLEDTGYVAPEVQAVDLGLHYTSFVVDPAACQEWDWKLLLLSPDLPHQPHGGLVTPLGQGRALVTLISYGDDKPALDWQGFCAWASRIRDADFRRLLGACKPLGEGKRFAIPRQEWRRYDLLRRLPRRLLVVGDAMCAFDPAFGQGMSVSGLEAQLIDRLLGERELSIDQLASRFFRRAAGIIETPWAMSRGAVSRGSASKPALAPRLLRGYQRLLLREAAHSPALHLAFLKVLHLEAAPATLLGARVLARVFHGYLRRRLFGLLPNQIRTAPSD